MPATSPLFFSGGLYPAISIYHVNAPECSEPDCTMEYAFDLCILHLGN